MAFSDIGMSVSGVWEGEGTAPGHLPQRLDSF